MRCAVVLIEFGDVFDDLDRGKIAAGAQPGKSLYHLVATQAIFGLEADAGRVLRLEASPPS